MGNMTPAAGEGLPSPGSPALAAGHSRIALEKQWTCGLTGENHDALVALFGCLNRAVERHAWETVEDFQYAIDCMWDTISREAPLPESYARWSSADCETGACAACPDLERRPGTARTAA